MAIRMQEADYASVQLVRRERCVERYVRRGGHPQDRDVGVPWSHLQLMTTGRAAIYDGGRRVVRILVKALYLFPLLLIPKLVLRVLGSWYGDLITIAFVVLVVITFGSLSLLALLHLMAGPRSEREKSALLQLALPAGPALEQAAERLTMAPRRRGTPELLGRLASGEPLPPGLSLRLRGRVDAGLSTGEPVIVERWTESGGAVVRVFAGKSFVLRDAGPPVKVELLDTPTLAGPYEDVGLDAMPPANLWPAMGQVVQQYEGQPPPAIEAAPACVVRQGDMVEVIAATHEPASDLTQDQGPYRGEQTRGLIVRCELASPMIIARG